MRILALSDQESPWLWDYLDRRRLEGIDLILSCGDLNAVYLSFLATMSSVPVLYVHGNHDAKYKTRAPEGCICVDDMIYKYKGLRILGLGGSIRYKDDDWQFTESEMRSRIKKLRFSIWKNKGFDILLTHAPAKGLHDGEDLPHHGFEAFNELMDKYEPNYFIHGHVHMNYGRDHVREDERGKTHVINAYERYVIEIPD